MGISIAVQHMRTPQMRRIQLQQNAWMVAQTFKYKSFANDDKNPNQSAGIHTELLFKAMWEASDVLTTRQIEVWHDPKRRFMTCDAPVLVPFRRNVRPSLLAAQYIIWPVSPQRVVALSHDAIREKAVIREATGELVGMVRNSIEQGRERMIFATEGQRDRLPASKKFRRRAQARLRCSDRKPSGAYVPPPGCCIEFSEAFAAQPDVALCTQGLHFPAPDMFTLA